ncbi:MAG: STAS domain-containing protein [Candidatus Schekmanbacteria bacterium]|nr:STAS domain-containing protein [Candidatus Schekmanbacteria bacterium]
MSSLQVSWSRLGAWSCMSVTGFVDYQHLEEFRAPLARYLEDAPHNHLLLNLLDTRNICSSGLGLIITAFRQLARAELELAVVCGDGHVRRVLETTRIVDHIRLFDSEETAESAVPRRPSGV